MDVQFFDGDARFKYRCAAVIIENDHILLHKVYDYWTPPGGKISVMENSFEAVQREIYEESGEEIDVIRHLFTSETFYSRHDFPHHEVAVYYLAGSKALWNKGKTITGDEGGRPIEYRWFHINDLPSMDIQPSFISEYIHRLEEAPAHIIVDEIKKEVRHD